MRQTTLKTVLMISMTIGIPMASAQTQNPSDGDGKVLEEILIIGSYIRRANQADSSSPIDVVGKEDMAAAAAFNAADLVLDLPSNSGSQNQSDGFNQSFSLGTTNINLRGLGVSSTLTLLNGRRQTLTAATTLNGDQFVDLNSLVPTIAIEQVEILQDGASSLYGADAVAGVANFRTRKDFEGVELDLNYTTTTSDSQDDTQFAAIVGHRFERAHLVASVAYFDRSRLLAGTRRDEFPLRNAFSIFGQPGTFLIFPPPPTRTLDPACEGVAASDDDVNVISAGPIAPTCQFDFGDFFSLVAEEERLQTYVDASVDLGDRAEWFLEFGYSGNETNSTGSPSQPILFPPLIPSTNPAGAVLGGSALAFHRVEGAGAQPSVVTLEYDTYRIATGFKGDFAEDWNYEIAVTQSQNDFDYLNRSDTLRDRYLAALSGQGGPNNDQFYNPLFGATNDPAVREDFRGEYSWAAESKLFTVDAHITGELGNLPAGGIGLAVGVQYRKDDLSYDYNTAAESDNLYFFIGNRDFDGDQDVYAVFVEADFPLSETFNLQAALRYEDFGDDDTVDPKVGFLWHPANSLSVRGTFGTSFRAPSIFQKAGRFNVPARIFDPASGGLATIAQQTSADAANPVEPQESDSLNLGVTWDSDDSGWRISLDYWSFDYKNFITPENASAVVASNPLGPQVTRDPTTDALLAVNTFFRNAGSLETDGLDLAITRSIELGSAGSLTLTLNATQVLSYDLDDPVLGAIDGLGQRNFTNFGVPMPETRANLGVAWQAGHHSVNLYLRHIDSYDDENNDNAEIDQHSTVDLQYRFDTAGVLGRDIAPVIAIGARNLFDEMPPDVVSRTGYDALTHNPKGRQVYVSIRAPF